jgi:hypothetical protein
MQGHTKITLLMCGVIADVELQRRSVECEFANASSRLASGEITSGLITACSR